MRVTRWGWVAVLMTFLALASAGVSGNNLLYLLYATIAGALLVGALAGAITLWLLSAELDLEGPAARGVEFPLRVRMRSRAPWPCWGLRLSFGPDGSAVPWIDTRGSAAAVLRVRPPLRGLADFHGLRLRCSFPFGLVAFERALRLPPVLVWPGERPARELSELGVSVRGGGRPSPRKGAGEEFYSVREFSPDDDARSIHWKLSARAGRPMVAETSASRDPRSTVRVPPGAESDERLIEQAASACRLIIDRGDEAALEAGGERIGFGRGRAHLSRMLDLLALLGEGAKPRPVRPQEGRPKTASPDLAAIRLLSLACAAVVFCALGLIDETAARLAIVGVPIVPLGYWVQTRGRSILPSAVWTLMSLVALAWTVLVDWRVSGVAIANVHLVLYLLCYRALSPIKAGEAGQGLLIAFLGFFLASGLTISLWYFAVYLAFAAAAAAWLAAASGAPASRRALPPAAGLLAAATAMAAALFMLTPRVEGFKRINPLLAGIDQLSVKSSSVVGFTDDVSLGWFGELKRSSARVMRIKPVGWQTGRPGALRVRGSAFDLFDGRRWRRSEGEFGFEAGGRKRRTLLGRGWALRRAGQLLFPAPAPKIAMPAMEFSVYPMNLSVLFTTDTPWLIEGVDDAASFDVDDSIRVAAPYIGGLHYRLYANPQARGFGLPLERSDDTRRRFLQLPPDPDGRLAELARLATANAVRPEEKVRDIAQFLAKRYSYSTYSDGRDRGLGDFLFRSRRGNCEYFATAGAVLLREAGVPTRLVTGFLADEWNEYGRFFDVRQNEAHAWVEAYLPGRGWIPVEMTPAQTAFSRSADAFGKKLERWLEAAQTEWYRHIIGYDQYVQNDTFRRLGGLLSADAMAKVLRALAKLVLAGLGLVALFTGWLRLKSRLFGQADGVFARAQAALERAGLPRAPHWTPREFAAEVCLKRPSLSAIAGLAELHYLARYSAQGLSAGERDREERLFRELRAAL